MKKETDPIAPDEWLIRRVHRDQFRTGKDPYVSPKAFRPRVKGDQPDTDGISLFRLACLRDENDILEMISDEQKRKAIGFVRVQVAELSNLGLTVRRTPIEAIRGHVSIPEMDVDAMSDPDKRSQINERMDKLAKLTSQDDRILRDPKAPVDSD